MCVLEVIVLGSSSGHNESGIDVSAVQKQKRQKTMSDFFSPRAGSKGKQSLPAGQRWFLLVQRPDQGLLAGLWEFPGMKLCGISSIDAAPR